MLPKTGRLRLTRDFERVFAARHSVSGRFARLASAPSTQEITRFGIVTSTKVSKKAVIRNRIRRRVRSIVSPLVPRLNPPADIIVLCQPAAASAGFDEFREDIMHSLRRLFKHI